VSFGADTAASLEPTAVAKEYCVQKREKDRRCGGTVLSLAKCLEGNKHLSDAILAQRSDCLDDHPCHSYRGCLYAIIGPDTYADDPDRYAEWLARPAPGATPATLRFEGTATLAGAVPVEGVTACVHDEGASPCAKSDRQGAFALDLPTNREVVLTLRGSGVASTVIGISTGAHGPIKLKVLLDKPETAAARYAAFRAKYPDERTGSVLATVEAPGSDDKGFEGLSMSIAPKRGTGPFYFDADSTPNANRTETSTWSVAVFANVEQGVAEITVGPRAVTCVPSTGWASQEVNRVRVPIVAGYETHVRMRCSR
jgi:hypothetical protein